ncbi:MAG: efflux RND transporter permease subunit [Cyanothece sp. SIO2G6]|nr:efflux RND transporter permease subunit [Cyanothece sp. SIO2G6]
MSFFFTRQIFAILLCFLLLMGGLMGYLSMVKEGDPDIQIARAMITTTWGGTDAETIENQVTDKIEEEIKSLQGLDDFTSATFNSFSIINVSFKAEAPVAESIQELRGKVDDAEPELPSESQGRETPDFEQLSQQDAPVLSLALTGQGLNSAILSQAAEDIQAILESVQNVREVNLGGNREEVIHVQMRPSRLTTLGISSTQVRDAIQDHNIDRSWDLVRDDAIGAQVRFFSRFRALSDLENLPVSRLADNRVVRLGEVADVYRGLEREENRAFLSWQGEDFAPAINVEVVKVPGSDTIQVVEDALAAMEVAAQDPNIWPFGMEYRVLNSDADLIRDELNNLGSNVLQASIFVFAILFVALTWREALIAGLAIPLTFAGALFILWMMGYTLNTMVMVGMILALGLLVDVFILMLEGMHDGIFVQGLSFPKAAITTVQTYAAPAFAGQLTTILAMAPLMAIAGTMGKFIRLIPISAITCLVLSYVIALLAVVPLSKFLLHKRDGDHEKTFVDQLTEEVSEKFAAWSLKFTVANRTVARLWTLGTIGIFVFSVILFTTLTVSLFPQDDGRKLSINVELPPSATLERSQEVGDRIGDFLRTYTDSDDSVVFESLMKLVGQRSNLVSSSELKPGNADYFVGISAMMVEQDQRERESFVYARELRQAIEDNILIDYPGAVMSFQYERAGGGEDPIQVEIYGEDMQVLRQVSAQVQQTLREIPGTMDVRDDLGNLRYDYKLVPKRESVEFYGFNPNDLGTQGRYLMIDNDIGDFAIGSGEEDLEIRLSTRWPSQNGAIGGPSRIDEFQSIRFINNQGESIAADALMEPVEGAVPLSITHRDTQRSVTVLAKNIPGLNYYDSDILAALGPKLEAMQYDPSLSDEANRAAGHWPPGYSYRFGGDADTSGETFGSAGQMLVVAIFLVFAVLVLQFGSYTQPIIIILTIPFALIGTFIGFFLLGLPFSFPSAIGIISLVGIVVNDAIVMVETMNERRKQGMDTRHAAAAGASDRLRPILTTTITTIIGLLPLAFSDPMWFPLCMAIIFGLMSATLIALLVVPGLYLQLTPKGAIAVSE